ncbi:sodium:calcium symporter [Lacunisphaera limnophila]|uniref:sodium:calcium symporter n=1 Tax=Lacunisphaera limnophila TaxID=1838286 RepID=UPI001F2116D5|nr:sodium:calcium symporter [Lacunisphaera limnophila]
MHLLPDLLESLALNDPPAYLAVFLGVSLLMLWRIEAMLDQGLEGTALGTLLLPYCSGLGNLIFVGLMVGKFGGGREVLTNSLVNNVTNLTLLLGLPALFWGLTIMPKAAGKVATDRKKGGGGGEAQLNRLSLLLTLAAVLFFTGAAWLLGRDGRLDRTDGIALIGLFLFWQCVQVFDVLKHNVRQRVSFGWKFYLNAAVVLVCAYFLYESIDWLVAWLSAQRHGFLSRDNLGWLTGWLMVLPNAILALYWGWRRRADVVYSSQVGDGHICIPLCLGLFALSGPLPVPPFALNSLLLLAGVAVVQAGFLLIAGGLPRWAGGVMCLAYGGFVYAGLVG